MTKADAFAQTDAADLAPFHRDPCFFGGLCERILAKFRRALLIRHVQAPIGASLQSSRRSLTHEGKEPTVILGCQATGSASFGSIPSPFDPLRVKAVQSTAHRLRTTIELAFRWPRLVRHRASHDHACMKNPVGWSVPAGCQFAHPALFFCTLGGSCSQDLEHRPAPFLRGCAPPSLCCHHLRNRAGG